MQTGYRRIYFDKATGNVITQIAFNGYFIPTTIEQDITNITELLERNRDSFDVLELGYFNFYQDFAECNGFLVNPETKELEFSYPDPNEEEPQEHKYQPPLSEEVKRLTDENKSQDMVIEELMFVIIPELTGGGI